MAVPIPPYPFTPGLDPELSKWLRVRRLARETKAAESSDRQATYATAVRYKYREWWVKQVLDTGDSEDLVDFRRFQTMLESISAIGSDHVAHAMVHERGVKFMMHALKQGFSANFCFCSGGTLLHLVVGLGDEEKVACLLTHGAQVNVMDAGGRTPLHIAIKPVTPFNSFEIAAMLIDSGADIHAVDALGRSLLHRACMLKNKEYVDLLLSMRADITTQDHAGLLAYDHCANQDAFRRWFDARCMRLAPLHSYTALRAKITARQFVKDIFNLVEPRCDVCKRTVAVCSTNRKQNFRFWMFSHNRLKGEKLVPTGP